MFSTIVFFHYLIGNIFLTTFETKCSNKMLSTKCYVKTWYGFKYTLKLYSFWKIYAFKMKFYMSLLYITTYMSFIKEFIYILLMHIMFLYYQALQYIVCPSGWVSRKLYQEKINWPQAPVIILFEFLCYSIHGKIIESINFSLYLWTNPFSLKWTVKNMVELLLKLKIKVKTNGWGKNIQILKPVTLLKDP